MGSGDEPTPRRPRLERETLRDLAPTLDETRSVRGAEDDSRTGKSLQPCLPDYSDALRVYLGKTAMSYACQGKVRFEPTETGYEMHVDLGPNKEMAELHEMNKQDAIANNPEMAEKLDEIGRRFS